MVIFMVLMLWLLVGLCPLLLEVILLQPRMDLETTMIFYLPLLALLLSPVLQQLIFLEIMVMLLLLLKLIQQILVLSPSQVRLAILKLILCLVFNLFSLVMVRMATVLY